MIKSNGSLAYTDCLLCVSGALNRQLKGGAWCSKVINRKENNKAL